MAGLEGYTETKAEVWAVHGSEKAAHVCAVFVRQRHKWTKDAAENELRVIKTTNYKNSDSSHGNTT